MTGLDLNVIPEDQPLFDPEDDRALYPGGSLPPADCEARWQQVWPESIDPDDLDPDHDLPAEDDALLDSIVEAIDEARAELRPAW